MECEGDADPKKATELGDRRQNLGILRRVCKDVIYRRKLMLTATVCWSYVILGWVTSQIGNALPDLQRLARIDLETASWIFTSWSIGFMAGSLISGFLFDKLNRLAIMLVSSLGMAICSVCLPYSGSFPVMIAVRFLSGIFCGGSDTGANTIVPSTWSTKGRPFMQALYLSYTIGGITSPLATRPFMSTKYARLNETDGGIYEHVVNSSNVSEYNFGYSNPINKINVTAMVNLNISMNKQNFYISNAAATDENIHIHYAFIVTAVLCVSSSVLYIAMLLRGKFDIKDDSQELNQKTKEERDLLDKDPTGKYEKKSLPTCGIKYVMLLCLAAINMFYGAAEDSLGDFLVTFCLDYLEWDNSASVLLVSMYWICSCLGGLGGILVMWKCSPARVLFIALLFWNASFLVVVFASIWKMGVLIWIFIPASGFSMVFIIPTIISWTAENVCEISGKIASLFLIATGIGLSVNPTFIGHMMEKYNYVYLFYILLGESVLCTILFLVSYLCKRMISQHSATGKELLYESSSEKTECVDI